MAERRTMRISEVARLSGLGIGMIRYYEKMGLLSPTERSGRGYRLFTEAHLHELRHILEMKRLGFRVEEIRRIMALETHPEPQTVEAKKAILRQRLAAVEAEIVRLESVRQELLRRLQ